jgi:hypothetical protein
MEKSHVYFDVCSAAAARGSRSGTLRPLIDSYIADLASRGYQAGTTHGWSECCHLPGKFKAPDKLLAISRRLAKAGNYVESHARIPAAIPRWTPPTPHNNTLRILSDRKVSQLRLARAGFLEKGNSAFSCADHIRQCGGENPFAKRMEK